MPTTTELLLQIESGRFDEKLTALYGSRQDVVAGQRSRWAKAVRAFEEHYGAGRPVSLYSVPGRTELCGNHTDHQNGLVMAAAVSLDIIAVAARNDEEVIRVRSEGFGREDEVALANLEPVPAESGHSPALIRGVAAGMAGLGGAVGGFDAYTTSDVLKGSGLSSSAAFEVCMGAVLNGEYNGGRFLPLQLAQAGRLAENRFFGKPSGLMDQLACAVGGAILIDLADEETPRVTPCPLDLAALGLELVITDTGGSHADLTDEYAAVRAEMEQVAARFGKQRLRQVAPEAFYKNLGNLRAQVGDRAVLRGIHFFEECRRVRELAAAIAKEDRERFTALIVASGRSSFMYNQNAYPAATPRHQSLALGLALSERLLAGRGAWRLQGGGFAGTVQAFVPAGLFTAYRDELAPVFGRDACRRFAIRGEGACQIAAGDSA